MLKNTQGTLVLDTYIANTRPLTLTCAEAVLPRHEAALPPHLQAPAAQTKSGWHRAQRRAQRGDSEAYRFEEPDRHTSRANDKVERLCYTTKSEAKLSLGIFTSTGSAARSGISASYCLVCLSAYSRPLRLGTSLDQSATLFGLRRAQGLQAACLRMYRRLARCSHHRVYTTWLSSSSC